MATTGDKVKVAVVGGGCAALTTAFELTRPQHNGKYEVTVYQQGWRLGGKGASGRGIDGRIEEHGLHLWLGFYENAFRLMREAYAERHQTYPDAKYADWRDAFKPAPNVAVADRVGDGWEFWLAYFPPAQGEPGDPLHNPPLTVADYIRQAIMLVNELIGSVVDAETGRAGPQQVDPQVAAWRSQFSAAQPDMLASTVENLLRYGELATSAAILEASEILRALIQRSSHFIFRNSAVLPIQVLDRLSETARYRIEQLTQNDSHLGHIWQVIDLVLAVIRGSIRQNLLFDPRGFDAINDYDWRDWLRMHGASERSLDSGFMRGIYDLAFAYEGGDVEKPAIAAGVALRGAMRMFFTYRGALFWRMSGGMGDIVFAPIYQVLKERGVKFEFFHRLTNVSIANASHEDSAHVAALEFDVQAETIDGSEYDPLETVNEMPSWPAQPDFAQLIDGQQLLADEIDFEAYWQTIHVDKKTLAVTTDFDMVVLGVSIAALPTVAKEIIAADPRWQDMVREVKTVATQSFQVWLREDLAELGWPHASVNLSGFVEPFDTWADMSHLIVEEGNNRDVKSIAYFCSVLADGNNDAHHVTQSISREQRENVRQAAVNFLERDVTTLWPAARDSSGRFRWELLATPKYGAAIENDSTQNGLQFNSQFWTANVNPTDRYVLSPPGSTRFRISPLDITFDNLTIAGDWTQTGLDSGCIESAVISGLLAASAISGLPRIYDIIGYNHP